MLNRTIFQTFLRFAFLSGMGWVCDFVTFVILVEGSNTSAFVANIISSYVGVTFVYLTSLRFVFNKMTHNHAWFLSIYWSFQLISILIYSGILKEVVDVLVRQDLIALVQSYGEIIGKIVVTPFNLLTNFLFMKFLTKYMKDGEVRTNA